MSRERLIKQIYFPKLVLPVATTMAGIVSFAFGLVPLLAITPIFYPAHLSAWFLLIPIVAVVQLVFSLGDRDPRRRRPTSSIATSAT